MKVLIIGSCSRYEKFMPDTDFVRSCDKVFAELNTPVDELLRIGGDAQIIFADAIAKVPAELMDGMLNLKLIHSEGVAYNSIDTAAAKSRGIIVCNNKGINAGAVAEQAILLMLGLLRTVREGDAAVRRGDQMEMKERRMLEGITELGDCTVGLIGLGCIGRETAIRLKAFGCPVVYWSRHRKPEEEAELGIRYLPLDDLLAHSDIVSLHTAVTPETSGMVNTAFLSKMKYGALLINTARGDLVDNNALCEALISGSLGGAGLDTVAPEPVPADHPLVTLPGDAADRLLFSPHLGGITTSTFKRGHSNMWQAAEDVSFGREPKNRIV